MQPPRDVLPPDAPDSYPAKYIRRRVQPHAPLQTRVVELDNTDDGDDQPEKDVPDIIYYTSDSALVPESPSVHYIVNSINWDESIDSSHPLYDGRPQTAFDADTRPYLAPYKRHRGSILHALVESFSIGASRDEFDEDIEEDLDAIIDDIPDDADPEDLHEKVANWPGSSRTNPECAGLHEAEMVIKNAALHEAREMERQWIEVCPQSPHIRTVAHEHQYAHNPSETERKNGYGGRVDVIVTVDEGHELLPAGVYIMEIKTVEEANHAHRLQAEAHRRWLADVLDAEVGAVLLLVDIDGYEIETHLEDSWPQDELWEAFTGRVDHIHNDTLFEVRTMFSDKR